MGASSVTGVSGAGDSHGLHKCGNQCGGCGCKCGTEETKSPPVKLPCSTSYSSGGTASISVGSGVSSITACK